MFSGYSECVNVHFENKDGGFFLKQSPRQHFQPTPETATTSGALLSVDRFTVFQSSQPISVRATYGPFSTKQTVPARYVVPDPLPLNTSGTLSFYCAARPKLHVLLFIKQNYLLKEISRITFLIKYLFVFAFGITSSVLSKIAFR